MKSLAFGLALFCAVCPAHARLGETREQTEVRYGLPKLERTPAGLMPLLEGARELTFYHAGFRIRCALLVASDGIEYIVREEYSRLTSPPEIKPFECEAILAAESGDSHWTPVRGSDPKLKLSSKFTSRFINSGTDSWLRVDSAMATITSNTLQVRLELPSAAAWETQYAAAKEQLARAKAPKF